MKLKIKSLECPKSIRNYEKKKRLGTSKVYIRNYEKKNTWNIKRLVDDSFVPSSKQPSVLYCKLTDF